MDDDDSNIVAEGCYAGMSHAQVDKLIKDAIRSLNDLLNSTLIIELEDKNKKINTT